MHDTTRLSWQQKTRSESSKARLEVGFEEEKKSGGEASEEEIIERETAEVWGDVEEMILNYGEQMLEWASRAATKPPLTSLAAISF